MLDEQSESSKISLESVTGGSRQAFLLQLTTHLLVCPYIICICAPFKVTDILDYEMALGAGYEHGQVQHGNVAAATGGPVAPRLDKLIR